MHPRAADPALQSYFYVTAADPSAAQKIADLLRGLDGVEAAYVKPPDEAP
jgi:hypothetical protein